MKRFALVPCSLLVFFLVSSSRVEARQDKATESKVRKIAVGGDGGWDYLTVDSAAKRLYVSRGNRIVVVDLGTEKVVGEIKETPGVHGVAVVAELGKGFTSNGGDDTVTAFDLKDLKTLGKIKVGGRPDAIHYDPESKRVFTFNHGTNDATAVDPAAMKVVGSVKLQGVPEAAASDGKGHVFVNLEDTNEIAEFDATTLAVLHRWSIAPGVRPTGLALDRAHRRLFSACGNKKMIVVDADKGAIVATLDIGAGCDGAGFDPVKGFAYASNGGDGTLTVVKGESPDKFVVAATIPTQRGARTMALDPKTHRVYLSTAEFAPPPAGQAPQKKGRRNIVPGSFSIVVVGE